MDYDRNAPKLGAGIIKKLFGQKKYGFVLIGSPVSVVGEAHFNYSDVEATDAEKAKLMPGWQLIFNLQPQSEDRKTKHCEYKAVNVRPVDGMALVGKVKKKSANVIVLFIEQIAVEVTVEGDKLNGSVDSLQVGEPVLAQISWHSLVHSISGQVLAVSASSLNFQKPCFITPRSRSKSLSEVNISPDAPNEIYFAVIQRTYPTGGVLCYEGATMGIRYTEEHLSTGKPPKVGERVRVKVENDVIMAVMPISECDSTSSEDSPPAVDMSADKTLTNKQSSYRRRSTSEDMEATNLCQFYENQNVPMGNMGYNTYLAANPTKVQLRMKYNALSAKCRAMLEERFGHPGGVYKETAMTLSMTEIMQFKEFLKEANLLQ